MPEWDLEVWSEQQMLRQESEMDCGVCVFGALTNLSREEILSDLPDAAKGIPLDAWDAYINGKGWEMFRHQPGEAHTLPCAHVHEILPGRYHWIFQAENGGIHDPNPSCVSCPPRMLKLSSYKVILSVTLKKRP